jgi:hypothetical protein
MKKLVSIILPFVVMTGCISFPVVVKRDPFRGETVVTADMWHTVIDSRIDNIRVLYQKHIKNGVVSEPVVTFWFVATVDPYYYNYNGESLGTEAYVVADDTSFKVNLTENKNLGEKRSSVMYTYPYPYGGPYFYFYYNPSVIIRTENRRILIAKIQLTPEIQSAILGATHYMIRFYVGDNPLTLEATPRELASVKKFLLTGMEGAGAGNKAQ